MYVDIHICMSVRVQASQGRCVAYASKHICGHSYMLHVYAPDGCPRFVNKICVVHTLVYIHIYIFMYVHMYVYIFI